MNYTKAGSADAVQLRALWQEAFGDGEDFLDHFFATLFPHCDAFCARDGETLAAMLFALPQTLVSEQAEQKAAYLYAVATKKDCRGKGVGTHLLEFAVKKLQAKGVFCIYLACEAPLCDFYRARGFSGGALHQTSLTPSGKSGDFAEISAIDYAGLRETLLADTPHIRYPKSVFDFLAPGVRFYRLQTKTALGCACVSSEGGTPRVLEVLPKRELLSAFAPKPLLLCDQEWMFYDKTPPFYAAFALD